MTSNGICLFFQMLFQRLVKQALPPPLQLLQRSDSDRAFRPLQVPWYGVLASGAQPGFLGAHVYVTEGMRRIFPSIFTDLVGLHKICFENLFVSMTGGAAQLCRSHEGHDQGRL